MTISTSKNTYGVVLETTQGTMVANPAFQVLPISTGGDALKHTADELASNLVRANRSGSGFVKLGYKNTGSLKTVFSNNAAQKLMLECAVGGVTSTGTLKGGVTDRYISIQKTVVDDAGADYYVNFQGNAVTKVNIKGSADTLVEATYEFLGTTMVASDTPTTGATAVQPSGSAVEFTGLDVKNVTLAGVSGLVFYDCDINIEMPRELLSQFGSASAYGTASSGPRKVRAEITFYAKDNAPLTAFIGNNTKRAFSMDFGQTGAGWTFSFPACSVSVPDMSEEKGVNVYKVSVEGTYDATAQSDLVITEL